MAELIEKIVFRNKEYSNQTTKILKTMNHNVRLAVIELLDLEPKNEQFLEWIDINILDNLLIMIIATVTFPIGHQIIENGENIIITEKNQDFFNVVIKLIAPESLLLQGSSTEIVNFILKANAKRIAKDELNNDKKDSLFNEPNFNSDILSEEHKQALQNFEYLTEINRKNQKN